jgi:hypothetical protein
MQGEEMFQKQTSTKDELIGCYESDREREWRNGRIDDQMEKDNVRGS